MTNIQELIETAQRLSDRLDNAANDEKNFSVDIQLILEGMSWEFLRAANQLQEIKHYVG